MTFPAVLAPGTSSCILFRQRMKVDLPQPEGPMIAVIDLSLILMERFLMAWFFPYHAFRFSVSIFLFSNCSTGAGTVSFSGLGFSTWIVTMLSPRNLDL